MFTLQILDHGQTFLHPLDGRPLVLGSGSGVDLQLRGDGIAARQLRIEFAGETPMLVALGNAPVMVNGRPVRRGPLRLGDRVELGATVLVLGQSVMRKAVAEDVLAAAPAAAARAEPGRRRNHWLLPTSIAAVLTVFVLVVLGRDGGALPAGFAELDRLQRAGSFELAREQVELLQSTWAVDDAERGAVLARAAAQIDALEAAVAAKRQRVRALAADLTDEQLLAGLRRDAQVRDSQDALAAEIVLASLSELVRDVPRPRPEAPAAVEVPQPRTNDLPSSPSPPVAAGPITGNPVAGNPAAAVPVGTDTGKAAPPPAATEPTPVAATAASDVEAALADAERLAGQGLFVQAIDTLSVALASAAAAEAEPLQQRRLEILAAAKTASAALIEQARASAAQGRVAEGVAMLAQAWHRLPTGPGFEAVSTALDQLREQLAAPVSRPAAPAASPAAPVAGGEAAAPGEEQRRATLAELQARLDEIRACEAAGDFANGEKLLLAAAELVAARDQAFAQRLQQRADEFGLIAAWHAEVGSLLAGGRRFELPLRAGRAGQLHGIDAQALLLSTLDGERRLGWPDVAGAGVVQLAGEAKVAGRALLGAATLLYRGGDGPLAEALLLRALPAEPGRDAAFKQAVDRVVARGRGESIDARGYLVRNNALVAAVAIDAEKEAQKWLGRLDGALRSKDKKARTQLVGEVMARGPAALPAVVLGFQLALQKEVEQIGKSPLKKTVERLAAQRDLLDQARAHAKELIFDEVRYFYPYKPPQVEPARYAEYLKVQAEVDRRVDAVRAFWSDDSVHVKVPAKLRDDLERLDWLCSVLTDLGALDAKALTEVGWARALPPGDTLDIKTYCRTPAERDELAHWQRVTAYNSQIEQQLAAGEREQLFITNEYRALFRHKPLAISPQIEAAARGHAEEMSRLGYFGHRSPTPGRHTPFDRMKLAGYAFGASENIAFCDSAYSAHAAWVRSSGHHRNLLNPQHNEVGIGLGGRNWVQNFGGGTSYEQQDAWRPLGR